MTHLMLTSALLFALLAVVAIAIGASLGIARDLVPDEPGAHEGNGLADDFGLGLQHATLFAQNPGQPFNRNRSVRRRV